jgi:gliding motility-associated-like protein
VKKSIRISVLFLFLLALSKVGATHLRAGEMTAEYVSGYTWRFYLTVYTNIEAVRQSNDQLDLEYAYISVNGVLVDSIKRNSRKIVGNFNETYQNDFIFNYTFPGPRVYVVSFQEANRNNKIKNIAGGASDPYPFYIETYILVSTFSSGSNNTPKLYVPPLDRAAVNKTFSHNAGAFDIDGDSLSYKLIVPKQSSSIDVPQYYFMEDLSLNPVTGDLIWDKPKEEGLYNIAFLIEEWRNGVRIGYVLRDMQIQVEKTENNPPIVSIPNDTCIAANTKFIALIKATDPDGDQIILNGFGGLFQLGSFNAATFDLQQPNPSLAPVSGSFEWQTNCSLIRDEPYQVVFKAEDLPPNNVSLADLKTLRLKVLAPSIKNVQATSQPSSILLTWDTFACSQSRQGNIEVFRRRCDSLNYKPDPCDIEGPVSKGFEKIATVGLNANSFVDQNLKQGNSYCYFLRANLTGSNGGKGIWSEQSCAIPNQEAPIITKVSVLKTDSVNGQIEVNWQLPPSEINTQDTLQYTIKRGKGMSPSLFEIIKIINATNKGVFVDSMINSYDAYTYRIEFVLPDGGGVRTSNSASTVDLKVISGSAKALLQWNYNVPWDNEDREQILYKRTINDSVLKPFALVASSNNFTDEGLSIDDTVCYVVETVGRYCLKDLPAEIRNRSQEICIVPVDSTAPCPPFLVLDPLDCVPVELGQNQLNWIPDQSISCNTDILSYTLYFSPQLDSDFEILIQLSDTLYIHKDDFSLAGCYRVAAINRFGIESMPSNTVCTDICVNYQTPNLITPNGDGANDFFRPLQEPLNVEKVEFSVYNRWGAKLYDFSGDPIIQWDGRDLNGRMLVDGVYYYSVTVHYKRRLNPSDSHKEINDWLQIAGSRERPRE